MRMVKHIILIIHSVIVTVESNKGIIIVLKEEGTIIMGNGVSRYVIEELIGEGAYGKVFKGLYQAEYKSPPQRCAVKQIQIEVASEDTITAAQSEVFIMR